MSNASTIETIDAIVSGLSGVLNLLGASTTVSNIIAQRIADGGRDWTADERAVVDAELTQAKAYAAQQIAQAGG